uniref:sialin-like n=1 Tax=Styela clava TaxID=7725 RepID=UPI0019399603|nr:sialin-like [Styela clava]
MNVCMENANRKIQVWCKRIPARSIVLVMNFLATFCLYVLRMNLSAAIVGMVDYEKLNAIRMNSQSNLSLQNESRRQNESLHFTYSACEHAYYDNKEDIKTSVVVEGKKFLWDENMQGLALGAYFYGYVCSQIIGAWIARKVGRVKVMGFSVLAASLCTILTPAALEIGFEMFVIARIAIGLFSGVIYPLLYAMWSMWAPPSERGMLMGLNFSGTAIGIIATLPLSGLLTTTFGWQSAFYVTGSIGCVWSLLWLILIYDSPSEHPRISEKEKNFIQNALGHNRDGKAKRERSRPVPWKSIFESFRIWVAFFVLFGSDVILFVFVTLLPTYLRTVMKFDITASAGLSAIPYIAKFVLYICAGFCAKRLISMGVKVIYVRKLFQSIGMFIPGLALILAAYVKCNIPLVMLAFTLCVGMEAVTTPGIKVTIMEMAPSFGGIIFSVANTISSTSGFIVPQIAGLLRTAHQDDPIQGWRALFWLSTSIVFAGGISFLLFGTVEVQEWAKSKEEEENASKDNEKAKLKTESIA